MKIRNMDKFKEQVYEVEKQTAWFANADWNKLFKEIDIQEGIEGMSLQNVTSYIDNVINHLASKGNNIIEIAQIELVDCPELLKIIKTVNEQR